MSHETLASAWSALTELQDLSAGLRDVIGNSTLRSIRSNYHPEETPRRFLEYAIELCITFDAVRFLSKTDSKNTPLLQEDLVSVVAHFLNGLANDCVVDQTLLRDPSHKQILGHALCSAVCTLRTCAWDCRPELRLVLCKQAGKLLNHAPVKDESLWLVQTLANLLLAHYGSATPLGQGTDQSQTRWKMLWEASPTERQNTMQEMVRRATDTNVAAAERILPMLDLCQLYWDTDALLIQACSKSKRSQYWDRVFYVPDDVAAINLALQIRFATQEQFAFRNMRSSSGPDSLQAQSYVMFRPGLRLKCCQDDCNCPFDKQYMQHINPARSKQGNLLRGAVAAAFNDSAVLGMSHDFFDSIYTGYAKRLTRWSDPEGASIETSPGSSEEDDIVPEYLPLRPRPVTAHSVDETNATPRNVEQKTRSVSQPNIHRRYAKQLPPMIQRNDSRLTFSEVLEIQSEGRRASVVEAVEIMSQPESPGPEGHGSVDQPEAPEFSRTDSVTTASTASGYRTQHSDSQQARHSVAYSEKMDESFPEAVVTTKRRIIDSPHDFEKSYPEVAVDPVTAIQEDNTSLFSDGGSMPMTTRSGSRAQAQKKWSGFLKQSKKGGQFAVPTVRFFASGKYMIAWTRYGGVCLDLNNSDDSRYQPINDGDIVLGAGGSRRYAVVARFHEAYTLNVYNLGDVEPGIKVNLGSCPKAMDMSKDDRFLAIKYPQGVRIFDLERATKIDHKLPKMENAKNAPGGHLVAFSHDSQSFMASTRMGPEKVQTYWSYCMDKSKHVIVHSNAPCGNIDDHGLTSLAVAGPSVRGLPIGFLSTFTEKGNPVILSMSQSQPHAILLRDARSVIGTRIHGAGVHIDPHTRKSNLVMVNHNNDIFWISDLFGRGQDIQRIKSLKRPKSMKPELMVAMTSADEASIFWIDQKTQSGMLVRVGKSGGMTKPMEIRLDIEPMCSG